MKTVATPCIIAVPSILIVAPSGTVNEATFCLIAKFFFKHSNVIGIVALLLEVENANNKASLIPTKNFL